MAKVFKVIMNILIILFIAALVALFVPPLLGVTTATAMPGKTTNMQVGSVAYGTRHPLSELAVGDTVIINTDDSTLLYEITGIDAEAGEITARTSANAQPETLSLRRTASKKIVVLPLIGYIVIALQSTEGMIILGLAAALLVILFIIADILSRKSKSKDSVEAEVEEEEDRQYFSDLAASQSRPSSLDDLGTISIPPVSEMMTENAELAQTRKMALDEELETPEEVVITEAAAAPEAPAKKASFRNQKAREETDTILTVDLIEPEPAPPVTEAVSAAAAGAAADTATAAAVGSGAAGGAASVAGAVAAGTAAAAGVAAGAVIAGVAAAKSKKAPKETDAPAETDSSAEIDIPVEAPAAETDSFVEAAAGPAAAAAGAAVAGTAAAGIAAAAMTDEAFAAAQETPAAGPAPEEPVPAAPAAEADPTVSTTPNHVPITEELTGIGSALENVLDSDQFAQSAPQSEEAAPEAGLTPDFGASAGKPEEIELAIPQRTLDDLLQEAYANGEDPKVSKDAASGITFVDFSKCL